MGLPKPAENILTLSLDLQKNPSFVGASVENGEPVTVPLKTLEELLAWQKNDRFDRGQLFSVASVPHFSKSITKSSRKTLVCHDFKGGYGDDRFVQGVTDSDQYFLPYWHLVDTFVYFSHHFVTIPPVGWTNAAHRNGVTVLGTFITEHDEGYVRCAAIFSNPICWKMVADRLAELAQFYGFDGWLINIENNVTAEKVEGIVDFLSYLTKKMHKVDATAQVIWYDSITKEGVLDWQNELNDSNSCFPESCDGILLNYSWSEQNVMRTARACGVGEEQKVYVGVDVFGRGCYCGGGFNSSLALDLIKKYNLSVGIFAPGWSHEALDTADFVTNNQRFWDELAPHLELHPVEFLNGFSSSFCTGHGDVLRVKGCDSLELVHFDRFAVGSMELMPAFSRSLRLGYHECLRQKQVEFQCDPNYSGKAFDVVVAQAFRSFDVLVLTSACCAKNDVLIVHTDQGECQIPCTEECIEEICGEQQGQWFSGHVPKVGDMTVKKVQASGGDSATSLSCRVIQCKMAACNPFRVLGLRVKYDNQCAGSCITFPMRYVSIYQTPLEPALACDDPNQERIFIGCTEADWRLAPDGDRNLLFSCTLTIMTTESRIPTTVHVTDIEYARTSVACKEDPKCDEGTNPPEPGAECEAKLTSPKLKFTPLGRAHGPRYRVVDLELPNPKYAGPDLAVVFKVTQYRCCFVEKPCEARVTVKYAENWRYMAPVV